LVLLHAYKFLVENPERRTPGGRISRREMRNIYRSLSYITEGCGMDLSGSGWGELADFVNMVMKLFIA
jgi:hypothetical protein